MVQEFKGKVINGELIIQPIIIRDGPNITIQVPSFQEIARVKQLIADGKRNIQ